MSPRLKVQVIGAKALVLRGKDARTGTFQPEVFCVMEFYKEKFATLPKPTQKSVVWNETAEFSLDLPTDEKRYIILKILQKNSSVLSLDDDLFIGQVAVCLKDFVSGWDPNGLVKKNNYPLTSKHGKTNKDRGFIEFKISFMGLEKQSPIQISTLGVTPGNNQQKPPPINTTTSTTSSAFTSVSNIQTPEKAKQLPLSARNNNKIDSSKASLISDANVSSIQSTTATNHTYSSNDQINNPTGKVTNLENLLESKNTVSNDSIDKLTDKKSPRLKKTRWKGSFRNLALVGKKKTSGSMTNLALNSSSIDSGFQNSNKFGSQVSINSSKSSGHHQINGNNPFLNDNTPTRQINSTNTTQASNSPNTGRRKEPPKSLSILSRQDSTASFDSSNRGHSQNGVTMNNNYISDRNRRLSANSSAKGSAGRSTNSLGRKSSIRKKISMQDVEALSDDDKNLNRNDTKGLGIKGGSLNDHPGQTHVKTRLAVQHHHSHTTLDSNDTRESPRFPSKMSTNNPDYTMKEIRGGGNYPYDYDDDPRNMTKEQLMDMVQRQRDELDYKETQIIHLEEYVDKLLVKIISCNPEILNSDYTPSSNDAHQKLEQHHSLEVQKRASSTSALNGGIKGVRQFKR